MADFDDECPSSPKVRSRKRRNNEKRANAYELGPSERLFCIESRRSGRLLIRPNNTFAYVHDSEARFSEGIQGKYEEQPNSQIMLEPQSFGYCYAENFAVHEIVGACHEVTLTERHCDETGLLLCTLAGNLLNYFSWLDPSKEEEPQNTTPNPEEVASPGTINLRDLADLVCPCSPKIPGKTRKDNERRAFKYKLKEGENIYCLDSHRCGVLLLRPDRTFAYVHSEQARFSEGVQGEWSEQPGRQVVLNPTGFGYCYWDSFDPHEIIAVCHTVTLSAETCDANGRPICSLPDETANQFSWLDPDREEVLNSTTGGALEQQQVEEEECPNSPKAPSRKKRNPEKRARAYEPAQGEQLFCPESHQAGMLLLRPDNTFSYVHSAHARFSEGVQGGWNQQADNKVKLDPTSYGYIYWEDFDENEIMGVSHEVTLCHGRHAENGKMLCMLPDELQNKRTWLDPTGEDLKEAIPAKLEVRAAAENTVNRTPSTSPTGKSGFKARRPSLTVETSTTPVAAAVISNQSAINVAAIATSDPVEFEFDGPNSPKVRTRKKRNNEKRAFAYHPEDGEQLFCPETHQAGLLLLRPNGSFAYVHDSTARFSEGVQGQWVQMPNDQVLLDPKSFGWCYQENFDADEIIGVSHVVILKREERDEQGRLICILPGPLQLYFSWLDPTKEEDPEKFGNTAADAAAITAAELDQEDEIAPCSPKIPGRTRKDNEKRACKFKLNEGEKIYCLDSHREGVLLLRPDHTFAYVHSEQARFSEGVQGEWWEQSGRQVVLNPTGFGYCYWDSFDASEIIAVCHTVILSAETCDANGRPICSLPGEFANKFSWLEPDREEVIDSTNGALEQRALMEEEECPTSPKAPSRRKKKNF